MFMLFIGVWKGPPSPSLRMFSPATVDEVGASAARLAGFAASSPFFAFFARLRVAIRTGCCCCCCAMLPKRAAARIIVWACIWAVQRAMACVMPARVAGR